MSTPNRRTAGRRCAAVIDIGSNSIKLLVAEPGPRGTLKAVFTHAMDARISAGIAGAHPRLRESGMKRGVRAVKTLVSEAKPLRPSRIALVATSAVRDAANGDEFCRRVRKACGHPVRILTGEQEALLIGRGLACDPALRGHRDFYVFDLGGGSLECLLYRRRRIERRISLPLGCVRLTEKFVADRSRPFPAAEQAAVARHVRQTIADSGFTFTLPLPSAVGTGGTLAAVRMVEAACKGIPLEKTNPVIPLARLRKLLRQYGALGLEDRKRIPGLPPARADVFPAALATLIAIGELAGIKAFFASFQNLRWGLAAELLAKR